MTPVITLSLAQLCLANSIIIAHELLGDCALHGFTLTFTDYEGVEAFRNKVFGLGRGSTRDYISMNSIVNKIDAAVHKALDVKGKRLTPASPEKGSDADLQ